MTSMVLGVAVKRYDLDNTTVAVSAETSRLDL